MSILERIKETLETKVMRSAIACYRREIFVGASVFFVMLLGMFFFREGPNADESVPLQTEQTLTAGEESIASHADQELQQTSVVSEKASDENMTDKGYADIKGAVKTPSLYPIDGEMRVYDLIILAGGLTDEADQTRINLAQRVTDQMVVYIPKRGEEIPENIVAFQSQQSEMNAQSQAASPTAVNINTADATQLQTLSGIGEKKATEIIKYREANGPFKQVDDLENVSGIGDKTVEKLREEVTVQ